MKNLLNNILSNENNYKKINFNTIFHLKKNLFIILSKEPTEMIEEIEITYNLYKYFEQIFYVVDKYYYDFVFNMHKEINQNILSDREVIEYKNHSIIINLNKTYDITQNTNSTSIFFDINNQGNIAFKPMITQPMELLKTFFSFIKTDIIKSEFVIETKYLKNDEFSKKTLIFDIQNSGNEKSIDVLLKNLKQYEKFELYLIWRTGSVDFDYSHLDVDNFWHYYQAVLRSDIFFTDDKKMLFLLNKLGKKVIYLGKNLSDDIVCFNSKNIFDIKNYIFKTLDEK